MLRLGQSELGQCAGVRIGCTVVMAPVGYRHEGFKAPIVLPEPKLSGQAACLSTSTARSHRPSWFQLAQIGDAILVGNSTTPESNRSSAIAPSKA